MEDIKGFEGLYAITKQGRIWSYPKIQLFGTQNSAQIHSGGRFLIPVLGKNPYYRIGLHKKGKRYNPTLHRLLALTYIPNPLNLPQVNHINGVKTDNRIKNLEWCTEKQNSQHAVRIGLIKGTSMPGEKHPMAKLTYKEVLEIREKYELGYRNAELGRMYKVHRSNIRNIVMGKTWNKSNRST